jgi:hypothetical protein
MDWTTCWSRFDPLQEQEIFPLTSVSSPAVGPFPASCTMGTWDHFPGDKAWPGHDTDHSPHLVSRSWMSRSYTSPPPRAAMGVLWDCYTSCNNVGIITGMKVPTFCDVWCPIMYPLISSFLNIRLLSLFLRKYCFMLPSFASARVCNCPPVQFEQSDGFSWHWIWSSLH